MIYLIVWAVGFFLAMLWSFCSLPDTIADSDVIIACALWPLIFCMAVLAGAFVTVLLIWELRPWSDG